MSFIDNIPIINTIYKALFFNMIYPFNFVILKKEQVDDVKGMRYNKKEDNYELEGGTSLTSLNIEDKDIIQIGKKKYVFVVQRNEEKYQKVGFDFETATFKTLEADLSLYLADEIIKNNDDFKINKKWQDFLPMALSIGGIVMVVLIFVYYIANYKEGGLLIDSIRQLVKYLMLIYDGLINSGIIQEVVEVAPGA